MTKEYFIQLAEYNTWANRLVQSWCSNISDDQWTQTVVSSFESISATVLHMASAEQVWIERLKLVPSPVWLQASFKGNKEETLDLFGTTSNNLLDWMRSFDEGLLDTSLSFRRLNGDAFRMPYYQVLAHIFNHSTYHRGQIVTLLRQVGYSDISSTDLLSFFRK